MKELENLQISIPESAISELEMVEKMEWGDGVSLLELIDWVNQVVEIYRPDEKDSRTSPNFTIRSFRHYQTLGCIDSPFRVGRRALYGFRHYLQALLVRKFLWEKMPSEQIASILHGKSNEDYKKLLFQGIEIVPQMEKERDVNNSEEVWRRKEIIPGVEIHLDQNREALTESELEEVLDRARQFLRSSL